MHAESTVELPSKGKLQATLSAKIRAETSRLRENGARMVEPAGAYGLPVHQEARKIIIIPLTRIEGYVAMDLSVAA